MKNHLFKIILSILVLFLGTLSVQAKTEINESFSGIESIKISIPAGDVTLKKSSNDQVTITVKGDFDEDHKAKMTQNGSRLTIDHSKGRGYFSGHSTWTISIPDGTEVRFRTGSGDIEVSGVSVDLDVNTGSGDVLLDHASGTYDINTGSGDIELRESAGEFQLNTGSGNIDTRNVTFLDGSRLNTGSGNVDGRAVTIGGDTSFNTGSGDVKIVLAKANQFDLSLNTGSGNATLDLNGHKLEGMLVMRASKKRGQIKAPFDFDSVEEIEQKGWNSVTIEKRKKFTDKEVETRVSTGSGTAKVIK